MLFKIYYITFYYFNDEDGHIRISALRLIGELEKLWVRLFEANSEFYWQIFLDHNYLLKDESEALRRVVFAMIPLAKFIHFGFDNLKFYLEVAGILQSFFNLADFSDKCIILTNFIQMVRSNHCSRHRIEKWPQIKLELLNHLRALNIENNILPAFLSADFLLDSESNQIAHVLSRIENVAMRFGVHLYSAVRDSPRAGAKNGSMHLSVEGELRVDTKMVSILDFNRELTGQLRNEENLRVYYFWRTLKLSPYLEDLMCVYLNYAKCFVGDESISQFKLRSKELGQLMQVFLVFLLCQMIKMKKKMEINESQMSFRQEQKLKNYFSFLSANLEKHFNSEINENLSETFTLEGLRKKSNQISILKGLIGSKKYKDITFESFFGENKQTNFGIFGKH